VHAVGVALHLQEDEQSRSLRSAFMKFNQRFIAAIVAMLAAGATTSINAQNDQPTAAPADRAFMKKAAQANIAEIEAGKLAQSKASSNDIKQFGEKMQQDHGKVLDELQALAKSKGVALPTETDEKHKALAKKLAATSGKQFDQTYASNAGVADHK
jgi:putative membrane protein